MCEHLESGLYGVNGSLRHGVDFVINRRATDTVNVPPKGRVRMAFPPDDRPGEWVYHCHIPEHHSLRMMANFEVVR